MKKALYILVLSVLLLSGCAGQPNPNSITDTADPGDLVKAADQYPSEQAVPAVRVRAEKP